MIIYPILKQYSSLLILFDFVINWFTQCGNCEFSHRLLTRILVSQRFAHKNGWFLRGKKRGQARDRGVVRWKITHRFVSNEVPRHLPFLLQSTLRNWNCAFLPTFQVLRRLKWGNFPLEGMLRTSTSSLHRQIVKAFYGNEAKKIAKIHHRFNLRFFANRTLEGSLLHQGGSEPETSVASKSSKILFPKLILSHAWSQIQFSQITSEQIVCVFCHLKHPKIWAKSTTKTQKEP